jgi:hypothetical protein
MKPRQKGTNEPEYDFSVALPFSAFTIVNPQQK